VAKSFLIDGYNLGFKVPAIADTIKAGKTDLAIRQIVAHVQPLARQKNVSVLIIFDGKYGINSSKPNTGSLKIRFTKKPRIADDEIRDIIRKSTQKDRLIVVSSDNEIRFTAQDHGVEFMRSEEFLKQIANKTKFQSNETHLKYDPDKVDIDYWLDQFQSKKND
jgi:predicted RNA-binding protein with PIN domain